MPRKSNQTVKIIVLNPEAIPKARERFTRLIYEKYIESLANKKD